MSDAVAYIWMNGDFTPTEDASVSIKDRGILLGDGVFDTLAVNDGTPVHQDLHFSRLTHDCKIIGISLPIDKNRWLQIIGELLHKNGLTNGHASVRTTVTRGQGMRGLLPPEKPQPTIMITAQSYDPSVFPKEVKLIICTKTRRNEGSPLSRIKSLNYADNIMAAMEAREKGTDDAVILNTKGHVTCASAGNIFIYDGQRYITPKISDGVLAGTTRRQIIDEYKVTERSITTEELLSAEAVFLTNSIRGIQNVTRIDDTQFAATKNHPIKQTG